MFEHILIFRTGNQAITAKHALSNHVQAIRSKVCEYEEEPAVIFSTEDELDFVTRIKMARALGTLDTRFNLPAPDQIQPCPMPVQAAFPWSHEVAL